MPSQCGRRAKTERKRCICKWKRISVNKTSVGFILLRDFNDGHFVPLRDLNSSQFRSFTGSQWRSVLFLYRISMTVGFVPLQDFSDGRICSVTRFQSLSVINDCRFSYVSRSQWQSVVFFYEISMTVSSVLLREFNDGQFCFFMRFQWLSVLKRKLTVREIL